LRAPRVALTEPRVRLDDLVKRPLPGMDHPTGVMFTRDGRSVTYLALAPGTNLRSLWRRELATGRTTLLAAPDPRRSRTVNRQGELRRQRRRESAFGITDYRRALLADLVVTIQAGRCLVSWDGAFARDVPGIHEAEEVYPDPTGRRIAWVSAGNLWCADRDGSTTRRLTTDAQPGVSNGLADYLAEEELDRFDGAWWSTSGAEILFARVDERQIPVVATNPALGSSGPRRSEVYRYPAAGGPNPRTMLRIVDMRGNETARDVHIDFGDGYLARVVPHPRGGWLVAALPRDQHSLHWHHVSPSGSAKELWVERSEPWINLDDATWILSDGRVVRATEATGYGHLEVRGPDGSLARRLTSGEWVVTQLLHVDEKRREVLFVGTNDGVLERHLYVVPLDAQRPVEAPERLTMAPGWHTVSISDDGERWVDTWSSRNAPPQVVVRSRNGAALATLHQPSTAPDIAGLVVPELLTLRAADGATPIEAAIFRPPAARNEAPAPAVVWVYGGPHSQHVSECWELTVEPYRQAMLRAGFTVILVDNRGTANRGLAFESAIAGAFGRVEIDDQAAVLEALAERGEVDLRRVAITGGSYGGHLTLMALAQLPDLFRGGVAFAPVVDWAGYDSAYTERYLGSPRANPETYQRSGAFSHAATIQAPLLVVHGTRDENVHPRHTLRLQDALPSGTRNVTVVWLLNERHSLRRPATRRQWLNLALRHLRRVMDEPASIGAEGQAAS
jgi:dipeptidyl-peptidase 4